MKKILLIILTAVLSTQCYSQIIFEKGYYIDNDEQRIECLIKNIDWKNNPTEFDYKLSEDSEEEKAAIKEVKEFGIYNYSKYVRSKVNIDRSGSKLSDLTYNGSPDFKEETLFLQVLVDGKSNLYQYEASNLVRFFYSKVSTNTIEQLIFKSYRVTGGFISENNSFRQQILSELKCEDLSIKDVDRLRYHKAHLVKIFVKYNQCNNSEVVNYVEKKDRDLFNLSLRVGLNNSTLKMLDKRSNSSLIDFGSELAFRFGIESEIILPFNKNKWSLIIEPTYHYFKSEKELTLYNTRADYKSIEIPVGLRHSFFLKNNSNIFINGAFILDITRNSTISVENGSEFEISKSANLGIGVGYKQKEKYSIELRHHTNRDLLGSYVSLYTEYSTLSVIFGYTLF